MRRVSFADFVGVTGVACALVLALGCSGKEKTVVLKLGHGLDVTHPVHKAMEYMADVFARKTEGKGRIDIYPGEQLGSERDMIEQVQLGSLAMTKTSTSPLESFIPIMGVYSLPYLFRGEEHAWKVFLGDIGREVLDAGVEKGLKGLCYYDAGFRSFYTKDKEIKTPEDLKAMKIRVQQSKTAMDMIRTLGASPTPIAWGELYTSLAQGVVDGAENNPPSFETSKHYEVCKFYSLDEHTCVPDVVLVSTTVWSNLGETMRKALQEAADSSRVFQRDLWARRVKESMKVVEEAGVTVLRPDKEPFMEKVEPMYAEYEGTEIGALVKRIRAVE